MTMQVQHKSNADVAINRQIGEELLDCCHLRSKRESGQTGLLSVPLPVQIFPPQIGSIASKVHSIGIDHGQHIDQVIRE
jgi:hypothetical protein